MRQKTADLARLSLPLIVVAALALAWRSDALRGVLETLPDRMEALAEMPAAHAVIIAAFVAAGFAVVPLSFLVVATAAALGPVEGAVVSWAGAVASAIAIFAVGRAVGRGSFESVLGEKGRAIANKIADGGFVAVAILRNLPVAPFSVVNLAAGASPIGWRDFVLGTVVGMMPGIAMLTLVGDRFMEALRSPSASNLALFAGSLIALVGLGILASRKLGSPSGGADGR
jgi:uncharacterized membrane protein YdjX (TVP38/TMEM64 family)